MPTARRTLAIALPLLVWLSIQPAFAAPGSALTEENTAVTRLVQRFLQAFEQLDMPNFIACFADDATVFFPPPEPVGRFSGKEAIKTQFGQVFAAVRKASTRSSPPFHRLVPEDLKVQLLDDRTAVVTFQLSNANRSARRTLVLEKLRNAWLIVHLHASNVSIPLPSPTPKASARSPMSPGPER